MTEEKYVLIKLSNDQQVIGEVLSSEDFDGIVLLNAMLVCDGYVVKWHLFAEDDDRSFIRKQAIISTSTPRESYVKFYLHSVEAHKKILAPDIDTTILQTISESHIARIIH